MQTGPYYMQYDFTDKWAIFIVKFQRIILLIYHIKINVYKMDRAISFHVWKASSYISCLSNFPSNLAHDPYDNLKLYTIVAAAFLQLEGQENDDLHTLTWVMPRPRCEHLTQWEKLKFGWDGMPYLEMKKIAQI